MSFLRYSKTIGNSSKNLLPFHGQSYNKGIGGETAALVRQAGKQFYDPQDDCLAGAWLPNDIDGTFLRDHSIYGNHGIITGADWIVDGLDFVAANSDYVEIGGVSTFKWMHGAEDVSGFQFTISLWMQMNTPEPDAIMGLVSSQSGSSSQIGTSFFYDDRNPTTRRVGLSIYRGVSGQAVIDVDSGDSAYPNDTNWHHILVTWDQSLSGDNAKFYVDGAYFSSRTKNSYTPSTSNSTNELHIGSFGNEATFLGGKLHSVLIYNRALIAEEISNIYNAGRYLNQEHLEYEI